MKEKFIAIISNKYLPLRYTLSSFLCFIGFYILYWNTNYVGNLLKVIFIFAGLISLSILFVTIINYLHNVYYNILSDKLKRGKREFVFAIATFVGFIIPTFLANYTLSLIVYIMQSLGSANSDHFLYQIKCAFLELIKSINLYQSINYFLYLASIINLGIFFISILLFKADND